MIDPVQLATLLGVGFALGLRHAFEPDHLAAVSTLATRPGGVRGALWLGTAWGVGHTVSFGLALGLLVLLDLRVPESVNHAAELGVAALLVLLGVLTVRAQLRAGDEEEPAEEVPASGRTTGHSFGFGLVHGLAGSGTLVVLVLATAASGTEKLAYLLLFGLGTVGGMLIVSLVTSGAVSAAGARWSRHLRLAAAAASMLIGCWLGAQTLGVF